MYFIKLISIMLMAFSVLFSGIAIAEGDANGSPSTRDSLDAASIMNQLSYSFYIVNKYRDKVIAEKEYYRISNNINLNLIKDREIIDVINGMSDAFVLLILNDTERKMLKEKYDHFVESFMTQYMLSMDSDERNNIYYGIKNMSIRSIRSVAKNGLSTLVVLPDMYLDYVERKEEYRREMNADLWRIRKDQIIKFNEVRGRFRTAYWSVIRKYNIPEKWYLSDSDFDKYSAALKIKDDKRRLGALKRMKNQFMAFPSYWYQLVILSHQQEDMLTYKYALEYYKKSVVKLFRKNPDYSALLVDQVESLDHESNRDEVSRILEKILENDEDNPTKRLYVAFRYMKIGEYQKSLKLLARNIDENVMTGASLRLQVEVAKRIEDKVLYVTALERLMRNNSLSLQEYLYYLDYYVPVVGLKRALKIRLSSVEIVIDESVYGKDDIMVYFPKSWGFPKTNIQETILNVMGMAHSYSSLDVEKGGYQMIYEGVIDKDIFLSHRGTNVALEFFSDGVPVHVSYRQVGGQNPHEKNGSEKSDANSWWIVGGSFGESVGKVIDRVGEEYTEMKDSVFKVIRFKLDRVWSHGYCFRFYPEVSRCVRKTARQ